MDGSSKILHVNPFFYKQEAVKWNCSSNEVIGFGKKDEKSDSRTTAQRVKILYSCLLIILLAVLAACFMHSTELGLAMLLPVLVSVMVIVLLLLYYFLWKITLSSGSIALSTLFYKREYKYSEVKEIIRYETGLWGDRVWVVFENGKRMTMRSNYVNYAKAIRELRKHCPIHDIQ